MLTAIALAAAVSAEPPCSYSRFMEDIGAVSLYRVKASGRTHFRSRFDWKKDRDCPDKMPCIQAAYLVQGDVVAVSKRGGGFACAWYRPVLRPAPKGGSLIDPAQSRHTLGLLPLSALEPVKARGAEPSAAWNGEWVGDDQILEVRLRRDGRIAIVGEAYWSANAEEAARGGVNVGQLDGALYRRGDLAEGVFGDEGVRRPTKADPWDEGDCLLRIRPLNEYLVVDDNGRCGGMNVTFQGLYRRAPKAR